ncbi:MAG TPA: sodium:solute symporter [Saprospiraceae bacterium]|nr:sodium:solute symporter [Saprospiraceae bacterium]HMQ83116.1 sodium:solute symporter [Saprospiraceae bacterium]
MDQFKLSTLDLGIMVLYALFIIAYGLYHAKRKNSEEYFLAGRNMIWPIVGISLFAANISSSTLVGLAGDAFKTNTHVYNYEWLAAVVLVFFAVFFLPFYLRSGVYTMPEYLERRYDSRSRYYFSFITVVGNVLIDTAAALYVGNVILKLLFPGMPTWVIIVVLAFAAAAYTIPGGLNSVIQTEVVQAILLVIGSCIITYFAFSKVGGWNGLIAGLNEKAAAGAFIDPNTGIRLDNAREVLSLFRSKHDEFMPWTGLVLGAPILGFYFWANNQFMVQRVLGAKDINHGRWGALFAGLLKLPVIFIMVLPGTCAILMYSDIDLTPLNYTLADGSICTNLKDCPNATYPMLLFDLLPKGILGLVLAGLLAAMMSSVSATFNSASTLITMDFVKKMRPNLTSEQLVRVGQISTLVLVVLASAWAPMIESWSSLWKYLQEILAYIAPPVAATFILGLFWKRANGTGSIVSLLFGMLFSVVSLLSLIPELTEMHFLHRTFLLFVLCTAVNIGVSLATAPPPGEQVQQYTWQKAMFTAETAELKGLPWYKNYRVQSVILLIITALVLIMFS